MIPKTSGKLRRLGIPTARDRCVQASLKLVLEPVFEADFKPCSYGFRPMRRAQDAIEEIHHFGRLSYEWILEGDIASCFDEISHSALLDRVRARIADKRVLALVKAFLLAGILSEDGAIRGSKTGTPQGRGSLAVPREHRPLRARRALRRGVGDDDGHERRPSTTPPPRVTDVSPGAIRGRLCAEHAEGGSM